MIVVVLAALGSDLGAAPPPAPPPLETEAHRKAAAYVFHPAASASEVLALQEPVLQVSQALAATLIVGTFMLRMRKDAVQMETIAGMMISVLCIALVPEFQLRTQETADVLTAAVGDRAVKADTLTGSYGTTDLYEVSPLMKRLWALEEQWALRSSPLQDSADGLWVPDGVDDEKRLTEGWNWAKSSHFGAKEESEQRWSAATGAERAVMVHRLVWGVGACLQVTHAAFYLGETLRFVLFHAGFAFAPLFIAGLGFPSFRQAAARRLAGLVAVGFWPLVWALGNVCTDWMTERLLSWQQSLCAGAFFPKSGLGVPLTVAHCAPIFSWSLLSLMAGLTLLLCLWAVGTLVLGPWILHRSLSGGVGRSASP